MIFSGMLCRIFLYIPAPNTIDTSDIFHKHNYKHTITNTYIYKQMLTILNMTNLPSAQKRLLEKARKQRFLEMNDFIKEYASPVSRRAAIERFVALGYLKESKTPNKYDYIGGKNGN